MTNFLINEVVQIFTFQFDESVTNIFVVVKVLSILMKFS